MMTVTEAAVRQLQTLIAEKNAPEKGLRVFVEKGGCAGLQYGMTLDEPGLDDEVIEQAGVRVIVDPESASFLRGATLDYADDLAGAGFRLNNPNAARSCGCGTSFEPAEQEPAAGEQPAPTPA
jgi:iron-sulfur cluster assembly accessory protein